MNIIGHQKIINLLDKAISKNAIGQAYLFSGPEKVGKFTVAMEFAEKIIGNKDKTNPDLIIIEPEVEEKKGLIKQRDIKIEQIRDLQHHLSLTAQGKHKIAIINDAHRLNKTAQNALLKTLEEANENVILILVSSDDKKLLPTILSRCQKIRFNTVSEEELAKNIPGSVKNKKSVLFWSLGRPGLMLDLINDADALDNREKTADNIEKLFSQTAVGKFSLAEEMSKDSVSTIETLNLWTVILRENILKNKNSLKSLKIIENIERSAALLKDTNSNARLVLENLFLQF